MWRRVTRGLVLSGIVALLIPVSAVAQLTIGAVEKPAADEKVFGMVQVQGWTLSQADVSKVDIYVDGVFVHSANLGIPRIDVIEAYPDWEGIQTRMPGFATGITANRFTNGPHTLHVVVTTSDSRTHEIGRRTFVVDNTLNQAPFGFVDIPDTSSTVDAHGSFPVVGWAADTDGIERVDIIVDGLTVQGAVYGDERPDVSNAYPDLPSARFSGFVAHLDTTRIQDGVHTLTVRARDNRGVSRDIGRRTIQIFNSTANLRPFGNIDEPRKDSVLYGNCGGPPPQVSPIVNWLNHITPVRGWALDLGTRRDLGRVSYVELMVDGVQWYSTDECAFNASMGAYTNCYGLTRMDVARYYPTYPDAPRSGFLFTLDVGSLVKLGVPVGHHVLKVRVGDQEQTFADIPNTSGVPVFFRCITDQMDFASFGFIDVPGQMDFTKGVVTFQGWAIDEGTGVQNVEIWVDGRLLGLATYGIERPDVRDQYPFLGALYSGWRFVYDTAQLSDGRHRLTVRVLDRSGITTEIGSTDFYTDNPD
jgi:N-acetylmuramoyl-L-alanine amidase